MVRHPSTCDAGWPRTGPQAQRLLHLLAVGELRVIGQMPWSSNYTFLSEVIESTERVQTVYKPRRGERPLWDFPPGTLAKREVAAFVIARTLGWGLIPPTVYRKGPYGIGSVQLFLDVDQNEHFFTFRDNPAFRHSLQALSLLDIAINNADRKGGHCLRLVDGCVAAIDQGLCFHVEPKLRTVIWDFAGEPVPQDLAEDLRRLLRTLADEGSDTARALSKLLYAGEILALRQRIADILDAKLFPAPPDDRRPYPWPLV